MFEVGTTADMHVQARNHQAGPLGPFEDVWDLLMPDAVLRAFAPGVGLLAVSMSKARVYPQGDRGSGHPLRQLGEHVGRPTVDVNAMAGHGGQALTIEDVGGVDDGMHRWQTIVAPLGFGMGSEACREGPLDLASTHSIHDNPLASDEIEDGEVGAGLLCEADRVPGGQVTAPLPNHRCVVGIEWSAVAPSEFGNRHTADCLCIMFVHPASHSPNPGGRPGGGPKPPPAGPKPPAVGPP